MRKMAQTVRWPGASNAPSSSICACRQVRCCTNMHANGRTAEAKRVGRCSMAVSLGRDPSLYAPPASPPNQTHATTYPKWPKSSSGLSSIQPNDAGGEIDCGEEVAGGLVVAGG